MKVEKGQILALTDGEYSDYCLREHVRVLVDFETVEKKREFIAADDEYGNTVERFINGLVRQGLIEVLEPGEVVEWWVGCYGQIDTCKKDGIEQ